MMSSLLIGSLLALCGAATLRWLVPLQGLAPSGPHGVGLRLQVAERSDGPQVRAVPVPTWFPVDAPYQPVAVVDAEPMSDAGPTVVLIHDAVGSASASLSMARELASHGFEVISPDHPGISLRAVFPDHAELVAPAWRTHLLQAPADPLQAVQTAAVREAVRTQLLDVQAAVRHAAPTDGVSYVGFGMGAWTATKACQADPRCQALVLLDGLPGPLQTPQQPVGVPILVVAAGNAAHDPATRPAHDALRQWWIDQPQGVAWVTLSGAGHLDLAGVPLLVRASVLRWIVPERTSGTASPVQTIGATDVATRAFLQRHVQYRYLDLGEALQAWPVAQLEQWSREPLPDDEAQQPVE